MKNSDHLINRQIIKNSLPQPDPNSHKNDNGKILIIGSSLLFHGAGQLATQAAIQVVLSFASKTNDMVHFASLDNNLDYLKSKQATFIGIKREEIDAYIKSSDVILVGPGLMREAEPNWEETKKEVEFTKSITEKVLNSHKKAVLDAGSLQVIESSQLTDKPNLIITPHCREMTNLFNLNYQDLETSHHATRGDLEKVGELVKKIADQYQVTILLKGPIDIIASPRGIYFSPGGNAGMTKGATGDVLAGVVAALYSRIDDPLIAAASGSLITKKAGENLWERKLWVYNAEDLAEEISDTLVEILKNENKLKGYINN